MPERFRLQRRADCALRRLIRMSLQQSIPWPVALQQSRPPLPLLSSSLTKNLPFASNFQRTATVPKLACLRSRRSALVRPPFAL